MVQLLSGALADAQTETRWWQEPKDHQAKGLSTSEGHHLGAEDDDVSFNGGFIVPNSIICHIISA